MPIRPSTYAANVKRSGIRAIMELAAGRSDVFHLEVGDPDFVTPAHIVRGAMDAALAGSTGYTLNKGYLDVRKTIAAKLKRVNGLEIDPEQIVVTAGSCNALVAVMVALVDPGEGVLIPDPAWPNYQMMIEARGARPLRYALPPDNKFIPDVAAIEKQLADDPKIRALILNSPSNPTGTILPPDVIKGIVEACKRRGVVVIADECYEDIVFSGERLDVAAKYDPDGDTVVSIFSVSKSYAMTGWRLGYLVACRDFADNVAKVQEGIVSCASSVSQRAAQVAIEGDQSCVVEMRKTYAERGRLASEILGGAGLLQGRPEGAFYCMVDIRSTRLPSVEFAKKLLIDRGVACAPGDTFGPSGEGFIRAAFATKTEHIVEGCKRIVATVNELR